jgi:acetoin utilization deacetylase AcuC-like enzyme
MSTRVYHHDDCLSHDPGATHPESAARILGVLDRLQHAPLASRLDFVAAPLGTEAQVLLAHTAEHWTLLQQRSPRAGRYPLDPDTLMSPGSLNAALRGVGAACAGVDALLAGEVQRVFCLTRPPGHHATPDRAMGFCLLNQIAIAALHAQQRGVQRVAVVDFDVHHGNGTQDILQGRQGQLYVSTHQFPHYPGTGARDENVPGNILNVPLPSGTDDAGFRRIFSAEVLPALEAHAPGLLLVSAGFDAHSKDPLASLALETATYRWLGEQLAAVAGRHAEGRLLAVLEGGYELTALADSVLAWLEGSA